MIIGFTQRSQTVSEGDVLPGVDFTTRLIDVATERTSERRHIIVFRYLENRSTAIVQSFFTQRPDPFFDAHFSNVDSDPFEEIFFLEPGRSSIPSRFTDIRNDFRPEEDECFTIGIFATDIGSRRESFSCNDEPDATNYFCDHTICILDDDGRLLRVLNKFTCIVYFLQNHLLLHFYKRCTLLLRMRAQWRCVLISPILVRTS